MHYFISLLFVLLTSVHISAQTGWVKSKASDHLVYIPDDLQEPKTFYYKFYLIDLEDFNKKDWLLLHAQKEQEALGNPTLKWKLKLEKNNEWSTNNMYLDAANSKMSVGYQTGTLNNGKSYVLQLISSSDISIIMKYGLKLKNLLPYAEKELEAMTDVYADSEIKKEPIATEPTKMDTSTKRMEAPIVSDINQLKGKEKYKEIRRRIRTTPNQGVQDADIEIVLIESGINVLTGSLEPTIYVLFKNGTVYKDCRTPLTDLNVEVSKELEGSDKYIRRPKWTLWKKLDGYYAIQKPSTSEWEILKDAKKALWAKKDEHLNNTFWSFSGSANSGSHKKYYKFYPNGRFEISSQSIMGGDYGGTGPYIGVASKSDKKGTKSSTVVSGSTIGGGGSTKKNDGAKNTGTYKLNGYTIELYHDNGWLHRELFLFDGNKTDKSRILIDDTLYWIDKD